MANRLPAAFAAKKPAFVAFVTAGFPSLDSTVPALLAMQEAGVDVIEVGVPFSDPLADGGTIAKANFQALANGMTLKGVLACVKQARDAGLTVPVVLMGYINPILQYGEEKLAADAKAAGVDGFIVVDLLPEDAGSFLKHCDAHSLAFVPLVAPTTPDERLPKVVSSGSGFLYCVSVTGVTGARTSLPVDLEAMLKRVRAAVDARPAGSAPLPIAVGFGLSTREHVASVGALADGVVMGSAVIRALEDGGVAGLSAFLKGVVPASS